MHDTAMQIGMKFIETYSSPSRRFILEIGSLDVNGSLRDMCPPHCTYIGLDVDHGKGVDIKIDPLKPIPIRSEFSDLTISSSQMEHDPKFWSTFLELCRVTKPGGFIYLNVPSNGVFHSYPIDAWRFYPDAGKALASFARDSGYSISLLESFTALRNEDIWNDFVAIFYMGLWNEEDPIDYLSDHFGNQNTWKLGYQTIQNYSDVTQDQILLACSIELCNTLRLELERLSNKSSDLEEQKSILCDQLTIAEKSVEQGALAAVATANEPEAYHQDGLYSIHNHDFMIDPLFKRAYARGVAAVGGDYMWHWRVHVGLWAASSALKVAGDFVECGVNRGFMSSAIMHYLDFNQTQRTFYLLDTFEGIDSRYLSDLDREQGVEERNRRDLESGAYTTSTGAIRANFSEWPSSKIIQGAVPETLGHVDARHIAFLHLDMNCAFPEIAALTCFWERLSPGAFILLDDYAYRGYESQKTAMDEFASERGVSVLSMPTGQGLLIKPASVLPKKGPGTSLPASILPALQHGHISYRYKGIETLKCPFDLALYALLIWELRPRTIFEIGSNKGGSAVWLADQLRSYGIDGRVLSYDVNCVMDLEDPNVTFAFGDAAALAETITPDFIASLPRPFMVIEDSSHQRAHSLAVMTFFNPYLHEGEYMIVEDAIISDLGIEDMFDGGPRAAIEEFLATNAEWFVDRSYCDFFGPNVTWNVDGYLKKR